MIDIYLYTSKTEFVDGTNSKDVEAYIKYKTIQPKTEPILIGLDVLIKEALPLICFGFTEKEEDVLKDYFSEIVKRQKENTLRNFVIRTRSINILRHTVKYVRTKHIDRSFIRINVEGIEVSFDNNIFLVSKDCVLEKILNWKNYEE